MSEEDNPITMELCEAYRNAIKAEIRGIKETITVGLSVSTAIITLIMYILTMVAK